jgi:hypothetical protein
MATRHPGVWRWRVEPCDGAQEINATTCPIGRRQTLGDGCERLLGLGLQGSQEMPVGVPLRPPGSRLIHSASARRLSGKKSARGAAPWHGVMQAHLPCDQQPGLLLPAAVNLGCACFPHPPIITVGSPIAIVPPLAVLSSMRAAGLLPISTVAEPFTTESGEPTHTHCRPPQPPAGCRSLVFSGGRYFFLLKYKLYSVRCKTGIRLLRRLL